MQLKMVFQGLKITKKFKYSLDNYCEVKIPGLAPYWQRY